jgi:hypothetical protein
MLRQNDCCFCSVLYDRDAADVAAGLLLLLQQLLL